MVFRDNLIIYTAFFTTNSCCAPLPLAGGVGGYTVAAASNLRLLFEGTKS